MGSLAKFGKRALQRALARRGFRLSRFDSCDVLEFLLTSLLKSTPGELKFVQIGANDGVSSDPLYGFITRHPGRVRGVVVEPVRDYFNQLVENYRHVPNIVPVNMAIHRTEKEMTIYRVDPQKQKSLPAWTKGIASFNPAHHELGQTPADAMIPEKVKCASLDELLKTHGFTHLDLLQIDTEGYDAQIIEGIDFNVTRPRIVRFEHGRLRSMSKETFQHIRAALHAAGYELMIETFDVTAYQPDILLDL